MTLLDELSVGCLFNDVSSASLVSFRDVTRQLTPLEPEIFVAISDCICFNFGLAFFKIVYSVDFDVFLLCFIGTTNGRTVQYSIIFMNPPSCFDPAVLFYRQCVSIPSLLNTSQMYKSPSY